MNEMECWSKGVLDYWVLNASLHYSTTPILHYSSLSRWSEEIEHNEAYESFSAACQRVEPGVGLVVLVKGLSFTSHSGEKLRRVQRYLRHLIVDFCQLLKHRHRPEVIDFF